MGDNLKQLNDEHKPLRLGMDRCQSIKESTERALNNSLIGCSLLEYYRTHSRVPLAGHVNYYYYYCKKQKAKKVIYKLFFIFNPMKMIRVILILIAFATVCISQIEVDLMLRNKTSIRVTAPKGAFKMVDTQEVQTPSGTDNYPSSSKKAKAEEYCPPILCKLENETEYEQFRKLWDIYSYTPLMNQTSHTPDLTEDRFEKFLLTADYLDIQGEYAKYFAKNMVKYGLLGKHSADIVSRVVFSDQKLSRDTFWDLLYAFLRQTGFDHRTIGHPSTGQTMLRIEKADEWPKQIDENYTGPFQETKMRTVLYSELGPESSQEKERNEAVLGWLLLNIGGSSVDIQYLNKVVSDNISELSQTIQNFTKENKKRAWVYVEGLSLIPNCKNHTFLSTALQLVPNLSCLKLSIAPSWILNEELSSLFSTITLCRHLKVLKIRGMYLDSVVVSKLVESIPGIVQLNFWCKILEGTAIDSLKKCTHLERLEIEGEDQPSDVVQELVSHLPSLKELTISCEALEPAATESFKKCARLEELTIDGGKQLSVTVKALVSHLPSLKKLKINCNPLTLAAAEKFKNCAQLEELELDGEFQPSTTVQALVKNLPSLKKLDIMCMVLKPEATESFEDCVQLERLNLWGEPQSSSILQDIANHLPSLKELTIMCKVLETRDAEIFENCINLEILRIGGSCQSISVIQEILSYLPYLKELSIICDALEPEDAEIFKNCPQLEKLEIDEEVQSISVLKALLNHLPFLKELVISCEALESEDAEGFQECKNLKKLEICGRNQLNSSFFIKLLEVLPSLKDLTINLDTADLAFADALRKYPNLRILNLTVGNYTPGFLEHYLKDPLPKLTYLLLKNRNTRNSYSEKDNRAVKKASAMGMFFYLI